MKSVAPAPDANDRPTVRSYVNPATGGFGLYDPANPEDAWIEIDFARPAKR